MTNAQPSVPTQTRYLDRPGGRVAYEVAGTGPLVLLVPGMGDLRSTYRFVTPALVAAGYRVASTDLRGHGDSDATFAEYGSPATAGDMAALIGALGGPAVIVGNSLAAASATLVAADHPELVRGLALLGPFVRNPKVSPVVRMAMKVALAPALAPMTWKSYLPRLYAGRKPEDQAQYLAQVDAAVRRPGHAKAFSKTAGHGHAEAEARLNATRASGVPVLVVMGEQDPDFPDQQGEADWIVGRIGGQVLLVPEAGHYPQSQQPEAVAPALIRFATEATAQTGNDHDA